MISEVFTLRIVSGADISDYFNYGFNEDTWRMYCEKQRRMRNEAVNLEVRIFRKLDFFCLICFCIFHVVFFQTQALSISTSKSGKGLFSTGNCCDAELGPDVFFTFQTTVNMSEVLDKISKTLPDRFGAQFRRRNPDGQPNTISVLGE